MITFSVVAAVVVAGLVSGLVGYYTAFKFYRSSYSVTNTSGDFGGPRGGVFALAMGCIAGMLLMSLLSNFGVFTGNAAAAGFITAMIGGLISGVVGSWQGSKARAEDEKNKGGGGSTK